ncbi:MAG: hypothetical protein M8467_12770 [Anaerolineae bacterium]|nr:hypothetical protein [Anaerolineae bacterium]
MPASQTRIITKLLERRQIEADLRDMLEASSELEFRRRAQKIASSGPQVLPAIVDNLDRADARMLTAMGVVATYLEHSEAVSALRQAVLRSQLNDQGRIGAMTILERYLGQPPDDQLLESLHNPEGVAVSSLEEMLGEADRNPAILVEYVQGMDRQEPDVVLAVVEALRELGDPSFQPTEHTGVTELLRLMAQDVREEIAAAALDALGTIRLAEAAWALQTLIPVVSSDLRPQAERLLRKLRFSGVSVEPLPLADPAWRALIGPPSALGQRSIWFIMAEGGGARAQFLNILLHDRAGALEAVGHAQVPTLMLPPERPPGYLHDVALPDGSDALLMLEASFDLGRRLVLEALAENRRTQIPVAGTLRLLSPWLWGIAGSEALPARSLPEGDDSRRLAQDAGRLLEHPAFAGWTLRSEAIIQAAEDVSRRAGWEVEARIRHLAGELFSTPEVVEVFSRRLMAMSEWLLLAGDEPASKLALAAAQEMVNSSPQQPFVKALIRRDLELMVRGLSE